MHRKIRLTFWYANLLGVMDVIFPRDYSMSYYLMRSGFIIMGPCTCPKNIIDSLQRLLFRLLIQSSKKLSLFLIWNFHAKIIWIFFVQQFPPLWVSKKWRNWRTPRCETEIRWDERWWPAFRVQRELWWTWIPRVRPTGNFRRRTPRFSNL